MSNGLFYSMGLDPRQFIGGIDQAKNALGGMSSPITGLTKLVGGLTAAFVGLGAGAVALNALKDAADFEKIATGLNTILKSTAATSARSSAAASAAELHLAPDRTYADYADEVTRVVLKGLG